MLRDLKLLCFVLALAVGVAHAAESDVLQLDDDDFADSLREHETTLVMFYAPWCGHCKKLKPEFAKAAELVKDNDPPIALAKVDCTEAGKEVCDKYDVKGYPSLKIFRRDQVSAEYNGPREAAGIAKYMRSQVGAASKHIRSLDALLKLLAATKEPTLLGYFSDLESPLAQTFFRFAEANREKYRMAHSSDADVLAAQGETNAIVLVRPAHLANKFEQSTVKFEGTTEEQLSQFVKENFHGLVGHRTQETSRDFPRPLITAYYSVDYAKNPKGTNYWRNRVLTVAKEFADAGQLLYFAISARDDFQHELNEYGYDYVGEKPLILARDANNLKYALRLEFSVDNLRNFAEELLEGELEPYIKSEPIPETNDAPVKIAVAKNFNAVVIDNDRDTLVEFYAPWCGHCKKLAPIYDELAEKLRDEAIVIAKIDANANDVPQGFEVSGFPTLFWLPRNAKDKPEPYNAGREVDDFVKFIAKHATQELKGYDREGKPKPDKTEL